jgi:CHASE2 domain-containing sensor protein
MTYFKYIIGLTILFGQSCYSQNIEDSIVLINVGDYDRGRIAEEIEIINTLNPKVISIDVAFPNYKGDKADKKLVTALMASKQVVIPSEISSEGLDYYGKEMISVYLTCAGEFFYSINTVSGFVSVEREKGQQTIPLQFIQWQEATGYKYRHFSIETAMQFDSLRTNEFIKAHDRLVDIDFKNGKRKFKMFTVQDVLKHRLTKADIEGKIVMLGFLGPGNLDKHISPLNSGSNEPDMYGLEYLAHIVAQILEKKTE